jgi:hypothetical protein
MKYLYIKFGPNLWDGKYARNTLIHSGVNKELSTQIVGTAETLFGEFNVTKLTTEQWVILSDKLYQERLGEAVELVKTFERQSLDTEKHLKTETTSKDNTDRITKTLPQLNETNLHSAALESLMELPRSSSTYGAVQDQNLGIAARIGLVEPQLGHGLGEYLSAIDNGVLAAYHELAPWLAELTFDKIEESQLEVDLRPVDLARHLTRLTRTAKKILPDRIQASNNALKALAVQGIIPDLFNDILAQTHGTDDINNKTKGEHPPAGVSPNLFSKTRANKGGEHPTTYSGGTTPSVNDDGDDPRDTPPPVIHGEEIDKWAWYGWSVAELDALIATRDEDVMYVKTPANGHTMWTHGKGDHPFVIEFQHGGNKFNTLEPQTQDIWRNWVNKKWDAVTKQYWPPYNAKAYDIRPGAQTRIVNFMVFTNQSDFSEDLQKKFGKVIEKIRDALNSSENEDKLEEKIQEKVEELLDGVSVFGISLDGLVKEVGKLIASAVFDIANFLLDHILEKKDRWSISAVHSTLYADNITSWVGWRVIAKENNGHVANPATALTGYLKADHQWDSLKQKEIKKQLKAGFGEKTPILYQWLGESQIPAPPTKHLPAICLEEGDGRVWSKGNEGAHVFLRLKGKDALYAFGLRTEVRWNFMKG